MQTVSTFALSIQSRQAKILAKQYGKGKAEQSVPREGVARKYLHDVADHPRHIVMLTIARK